mmetsp:Transcript_99143/g.309239  ORF Transcript_99143/g.309239 Transcript_99143/m.309239 type:complete len:226 (-) Transcript_99143:88-765(-)
MLRHRRDLHRVETVGSQVLLALPRDVPKVPLPELREDGAARLPAQAAARGLLVTAVAAEDLAAFRSWRGNCRARARRGRLQLDQFELLPVLDREAVGIEAAVGLRAHRSAARTPDGDPPVLVADDPEFLRSRKRSASRPQTLIRPEADIVAQVARKRGGAVAVVRKPEARRGADPLGPRVQGPGGLDNEVEAMVRLDGDLRGAPARRIQGLLLVRGACRGAQHFP